MPRNVDSIQTESVQCVLSVKLKDSLNSVENLFHLFKFSLLDTRCTVNGHTQFPGLDDQNRKSHYVRLTLHCACVGWYGTCMTFAWFRLDETVCVVVRSKWLGLSVAVRVRVRARDRNFIPSFFFFCLNVAGEVTRRRLRKHKPGLQSGPVLLLVSGLGMLIQE